uniref:Uncharacterized protein n=1 Tax=Triticum urartu TaxID=4572 RepID=A0A8R7V9D1_TRIUA
MFHGEEKLLRSHLLKEDAHHPRCSTSPPSVACQAICSSVSFNAMHGWCRNQSKFQNNIKA